MRNFSRAALAAFLVSVALGCSDAPRSPNDQEAAFGEPKASAPIELAVERKLSQDSELGPGEIQVEADAGVVTLSGEVASSVQKGKAEELAKEVPGVERVENRILIASAGLRGDVPPSVPPLN